MHLQLSPQSMLCACSPDKLHWSWQVTETLQPYGEAFPQLADAEEQVYDTLVALRCASFLPAYAQVRPSAAPAPTLQCHACASCAHREIVYGTKRLMECRVQGSLRPSCCSCLECLDWAGMAQREAAVSQQGAWLAAAKPVGRAWTDAAACAEVGSAAGAGEQGPHGQAYEHGSACQQLPSCQRRCRPDPDQACVHGCTWVEPGCWAGCPTEASTL